MPIDPLIIHRGVKNRDPQAESELVTFLKSLVWRDYERTLGPLAEDYLQELSMRVIEAIRGGKVNDPEKLIPYCQDIAKNVRVDGLRIAVRQARKLVAIDEARFEQSGDNAELEMLKSEQLRTILKLMERLDPFSGEVVRRYYFEHQSVAEIAGEFTRTEFQIQRLKDRAVEKLRKHYRALTDAQGWQVLHGRKTPDGGSLEIVFAVAAA
jgi:RNA polymerase sigma factor (sigma-70 family)